MKHTMKKRSHLSYVVYGILLLISSQHLSAAIFDLTVESGGQTFQESYDKAEDLINGIDESYIRERITGYTDTSAVSAQLNFRGVPISLTFQTNSTQLTLNIPSIGVQEVFTGATRDDSADQLEDWFKKNGGAALTQLTQELVASTPNDPIAGNPNSLMSYLVHTDYGNGLSPHVSTPETVMGSSTDVTNANLIGIGARFGAYRQGDMDSQHLSIPLSYTFRMDDSDNTLNIRMPLVMTEVDGARAYNVGLGLGFGWRLTDRWAITPAINYAAVASADLGSVSQIVSSSITSAYQFKIGKSTLNIGNMLGHYKTLKFSSNDYSFDPDLANTVTRNGLMWSIPTPELWKKTTLQLFITDTRFFGSELYIDQYNEIGFSFGFSKNKRKAGGSRIKNYLSDLQIGVTYLHANDSKGFSLNFGYKF